MKLAPVFRALKKAERCKQTIVHTGQHYDKSMSQVFFDQLAIPQPNVNLEVGSATHAQQTAEIHPRT
jgi:UDP-N-acetylglucosamine 2-epimerase (non-hydrolysing)